MAERRILDRATTALTAAPSFMGAEARAVPVLPDSISPHVAPFVVA